jgi:diacylglycerol kinase family enzyme
MPGSLPYVWGLHPTRQDRGVTSAEGVYRPRSASLHRGRLLKLLLIVNSSASSVTARARVVIQKALSADHEVSVSETSRRGHAARLAQGAAATGADVVVVLGGDGTLNEAANGLAGSRTALACLPGGSTNVFARTLGLPDDPVEATGSLLDALGRASIRRIGLGSVNKRYFLFHCGMGFDAAVVAEVEKRGQLKRYAGHPLFIFATVDTWLRRYDRRHPWFAVEHDDGTTVDDGYFAICFNTDPYTYLGTRPLSIAPDATLDTPLAMVTVRSLRLGRLLGLVGAVLRGRGVEGNRVVDYRANVEGVTVKGHRPFPYQVDGDYLGEVTSLRLRFEPDVLDLVIP